MSGFDQFHFERFMEVLWAISNRCDAIKDSLEKHSNADQQIKLQVLITRREAMIAENQARRYYDREPTYTEIDFAILAEQIEKLLSHPGRRST